MGWGSRPSVARTLSTLSVPDLKPIPVGRISTALRAQRASFQDGFRDAAGNEIAFETLDQVREVIRRAYLAGGLGPAPVAVEPRPIDPLLHEPERPPAGPRPREGGLFLDEQLDRLGSDRLVSVDYSALQHLASRRDLLEALHREETTAHFYQYLREFGAATLLEFLRVRWDHFYRPDERQTLAHWIRLLIATGLWDSPVQYRDFLAYADLPNPAHDLLADLAFAFTAEPSVALKGLLFRMPCPLRQHWDRHIHTLGHKLLLALVDRDYFAMNPDLPEFIPALLCSLVITVTPALAVTAVPAFQSGDRHRLLGRALWWLAREMPNVILPDVVEQHLSDFAWGRLHENPARD